MTLDHFGASVHFQLVPLVPPYKGGLSVSDGRRPWWWWL